MNNVQLPDDCAKQWEVLLLLLSSEEKKIDRTNETEIDTMCYFFKNEGVRKILSHWLDQMRISYAKKRSETDTALKSDEISLLWRQRGNEKFRSNRIEESYKCYCESILYADQSGPMYPLALANRSAALLRLKKFPECLLDVERALLSGYPQEARHKLHLRRTDCHIEMGSPEGARCALNDACTHASHLQLPSPQAEEFERHVKTLERKLEGLQQAPPLYFMSPPLTHKGENPNFNAASSVLDLRYAAPLGRYVTTREDLHRGDVLFSEEPYAWVTLPEGDFHRRTCETCCDSQINPLPCATCSRSVYCSEECRERGFALFHRIECKGMQAEIFPTIGIAHLALRVLLISTSAGFPPLPHPTDAAYSARALFKSYANIDRVAIYKKETPPFYRMFNLVTNFEMMNRADYIQYAITASMLVLYLEKFTTFFEELPAHVPFPLPMSELRMFAAALILRSLGQLISNGHAALTLSLVDDGEVRNEEGLAVTMTEREMRRATAIYPSAAMMNHSCDPNIISKFFKGRLVVVSAKDTPAGSEVTNCYGPHRARETLSRRRALLRSQYMFNCHCSACSDNTRLDYLVRVSGDTSAMNARFFKGRLVVVSAKDTPAGSEVTNCYGPHRARETLSRRRALLRSQYMFNCHCSACSDNTRLDYLVRVSGDTSAMNPRFFKGRLGSEVTNCYGPHRARETLSRRRALLRSQYMFNCHCSACSDNTRLDYLHLFTAYACQSCKGPVTCLDGIPSRCPQCQAEFRIDFVRDALDRAAETFAAAWHSRHLAEKLEKAQAALRLQQYAYHRHNILLRESADKVARLYADCGDFNKSIELIKQNIQSLEYQYGSFSAEVAHELRKLSDVMLERIMAAPHSPEYRNWCLEAHKITKKAVQLTDLNYGAWEPLVKRLNDNEQYVAALVTECTSADLPDNIHQNLHYNLKI